MLKHSAEVAAAAAARAAAHGRPGSSSILALQSSDGLLEDKRSYQAGMRARRPEIEAGKGLTADGFVHYQQGAKKRQ